MEEETMMTQPDDDGSQTDGSIFGPFLVYLGV
jgi:hypothetical protein